MGIVYGELPVAIPVIGNPDQGAAFGDGVVISRTIVDHIGLATTDAPNPRYPWSPRSTSSLYGTDNAIPGSWTVPAGTSIGFGPPKGHAIFGDLGDVTSRFTYAALTGGGSRFDAMLRFRAGRVADYPVTFGFASASDGSDIMGVGLNVNPHVLIDGDDVGGAGITTWLAGVGADWGYLWCTFNAGIFTFRVSPDGWEWDAVTGYEPVTVPTKVGFLINSDAGSPVPVMYLDFLALGNSDPQGQ